MPYTTLDNNSVKYPEMMVPVFAHTVRKIVK